MTLMTRWSYRDLWTLLALLATSVLAFRGAWSELATEILRREDNGYILIVPFVAGYLAWIRRSRFRYVRRRPSLSGPALFVGAAFLGWFGVETDTRIAIHASAVISLIACFVTLAGFAVLKRLAPVFLCFVFLLPVPGEVRRAIAGPLQELAVIVTHDVLGIVGIPCERSGISILINDKEILVGEACDGMRMVFALALTFYAFVFSIPLRMQARAVLLIASPFVALFCNMVRLIATGLAYAFSTSNFAEEFHDIAGWLMLPLAIILLQAIVRFMRWLDLPVYTWRFLQA
ncbi:MAG: exosortase/archaeosortase family protein [Limnohabitans sp.]|nr:exosortase/archaeosortase family protein [Limnohabitans sp.]